MSAAPAAAAQRSSARKRGGARQTEATPDAAPVLLEGDDEVMIVEVPCAACKKTNQAAVSLSSCAHVLHAHCYNKNGTCPMCKKALSWREEALLMNRVDYLATGAKRQVAPPLAPAATAWVDLEKKNRAKALVAKAPAAAAPKSGGGKKKGGAGYAKTTSASPWASGTGYGGVPTETTEVVSVMQKKALEQQKAMDQAVTPLVVTLVQALRSADKSQGPAIEALFRVESGVLSILMGYLDNGSVEDIAARMPLYEALLDLTNELAMSHSLVPLCLEGSPSPLVELLTNLSYVDGLSSRALLIRDQALNNAVHHPHFVGQAEIIAGQAKQSRAHRRQLAERANQVAMSSSATQQELETAYVQALRPLQFRSLTLLDLHKSGRISHIYLQPSTPASYHPAYYGVPQQYYAPAAPPNSAARLSRIRRELAALQASLPLTWGSSAFFVVDEEKPEYFSFLLVGPEGTPYQNGLFQFDCQLPPDFPQSPPKVTLATTGGGRVRFNPNLYKDGKVCLSLLGTWAGPSWDPKTSSLLQVIVSIQSLILVPDPYFNEPGVEGTMNSSQGKAASAQYNAYIRVQTLRYAMLEMMQKPPFIFQDAVALHFKLKANEIKAQCDKWAKQHQEVYDVQVRGHRHVVVADLGPVSTFVQVTQPLVALLSSPSSASASAPISLPVHTMVMLDEVIDDVYDEDYDEDEDESNPSVGGYGKPGFMLDLKQAFVHDLTASSGFEAPPAAKKFKQAEVIDLT